MKIFKYEIPIQDQFSLELPESSSILSLQVQNGKPYIWVILDENNKLIARYFSIVGTGQELERFHKFITYIGTIQMESLVWHLFEEWNDHMK